MDSAGDAEQTQRAACVCELVPSNFINELCGHCSSAGRKGVVARDTFECGFEPDVEDACVAVVPFGAADRDESVESPVFDEAERAALERLRRLHMRFACSRLLG